MRMSMKLWVLGLLIWAVARWAGAQTSAPGLPNWLDPLVQTKPGTIVTKAGEGEGTVLLLSDIHLYPYDDSGLLDKLTGNDGQEFEPIPKDDKSYNDTHSSLFESLLKEIRGISPKPDYVVVTGDMVSHKYDDDFKTFQGLNQGVAIPYDQFVLNTITYVSRKVQEALGPNTPVFFCLGNNDSEVTDNNCSPETLLWNGLVDAWGLADAVPATFEGYYAVDNPVVPNLEMVALNTNFFSAKCEDSQGAAQREMDWLKNTFSDAANHNKKVTLFMHIPPGIDGFSSKGTSQSKPFWGKAWAKDFIDLLADHPGLFTNGFAGHTHQDDFRALGPQPGKLLFALHITPGISCRNGNNPVFQVGLFDKATGNLKDFAAWTGAMCGKDPGAMKKKEVKWSYDYDFRETYGEVNPSSPDDLAKLSDTVFSDPEKRDLFRKYYVASSDCEPVSDNLWESLHKYQVFTPGK